MTKQNISLKEAINLLNNSSLDGSYLVEFVASDRIEATDAIKLGSMGIVVPEENIYYDDDNIADDDDFDGKWIPIESDIEHYKKHLTIQLTVDKEIENWLSSTEIDLDSLISELLTGFYRSSKAINK
jgi:hypothetical protein